MTRKGEERRKGKEKEEAREREARRKEERKAMERATAGKKREIGGTSIIHDQRWMEPFRGYCGHCWKWGHKKVQCPQWQVRRPMELGAMVSHPSQTVVSDPGSSVSQRVQAVNSSPVSRVCWSESVDDEEDWPDEWWHDSEGDWMEGRLAR